MKYSASLLLSALYAVGVSAQYGGGSYGDGTVNNNAGNGVGALPNAVETTPPSNVVGSLPNTESSSVPLANTPTTQTQRGVVNCRNQICYSMAIPQTTSSQGVGNIFFQIYAPTTFTWVGMGTGSSMSDSNMFIMYQDGLGNVTVSGRQAAGYTMPTVPTQNAPLFELLEGSGVDATNGIMIANFRCVNCQAWKNSQLNFASTSEPMIGAWQTGNPLNSIDVNAQIGKHTGNVRSFTFDTTQAQVVNNVNPFVGANAVPAEVSGDATQNGGNGNAGTGSSELLKRGLGLAVVLAAVPLVVF